LLGIDSLNIKRSNIPALTHVDYSARIQTAHKKTNPKYHDLITGMTNARYNDYNFRGEVLELSPVEKAFYEYIKDR
jgi:carbamoyltransferase